MTNLIAQLAQAFIDEEPTLTQQQAISAAMNSLGLTRGVSIHSIVI
jgi:hypothetical protein